jgi:hypothetical protein
MANFFFRQPVYCLKDPRKAWATRQAMQAYRRAHPICEFDGKSTKVHIHHIEPIQFAPERAADPDNFISLSPKAHLIVGHAGDFKQYVRTVRSMCAICQVVKVAPVHNTP